MAYRKKGIRKFKETVVGAVKRPAAKYWPLSTGERAGCGAFLAAVLLAGVDLRLAAGPLLVFILLCAVAPFIPASSFFLPVISRGTSRRKAVALTFDDGPDPLTTPELLLLLKKHRVKGTFFVNGRKATRYPGLLAEILAQGHTLANHSFNHDTLSAFKSVKTMAHEIEATQSALRAAGVVALAYRPPMGITAPRLGRLMTAKDMYVVNFSCRARDGGNRWIRHLSQKILKRVRPDDIVLLHDIMPKPPSLLPYWVNEIDLIIKGIQAKGMEILPLADIIGRPVMMDLGANDWQPDAKLGRGPSSDDARRLEMG
jgi:peptidoglycan/xylan/chitin deacetylase (PgdA/CDA1 family)